MHSVRSIPATTRALVVRQAAKKSKPVYHDATIEEKPIPSLKDGEVLVKINAAAFNHRDVRSLSHIMIYGAGIVVASSKGSDELLNKRVFLVPMRGWENDPESPESPQGIGILGGGARPPIGTFSEYVAVERDQVILSPAHLDDVHVAAWPLGGVTSWRAVAINARVEIGHNVLITGIGGGVALLSLQLCLAKGSNVYVTSSSETKISQAVALGASGGVNYKHSKVLSSLEKLLKANGQTSLNSVIDSGGDDIARKLNKILKQGGRIVCYGMTGNPQISFSMREVLKNHQLIGSTMGSHQDLIDGTRFIAEHGIVPVVSHVFDGLDGAEEGFELMNRGGQFGKIVIRLQHSDSDSVSAKL
ncbi:hypothetical protein EWM64_g8262 [Hericium alpestre]|uniref:Enoyl reductase (ER) domain-containing protein n=1 Tax=Hericium alpestre TaxID=135208 RepID=A0A4Y9ZQL6_9AGAM|nr:hypothetical protein EWM64_g8262 [Hericium alpestre]